MCAVAEDGCGGVRGESGGVKWAEGYINHTSSGGWKWGGSGVVVGVCGSLLLRFRQPCDHCWAK